MIGVKILVCGKGGVGKSVVSALIAKELAKRGKKVLVVDTDESNFGIYKHFGVEQPKDFMDYLGGKNRVKSELQKSRNKGEEFKLFDKLEIDNIPRDYVVDKDGIKIIAIGKIHDFGEGCACPMGAVAKEFLQALKLKDGEFVVVDTDAGIEHFGRGVEAGCDIVAVVVEPSYESIILSEKIAEMSRKIGKKVVKIGNKVDENLKEFVKADVYLPHIKEIQQACLLGKEIPFVDEAKEIVDVILGV